MKTEYKIETKIHHYSIHQKVYSVVENMVNQISSVVIDTKEKQFINALIKLGWTPPKDTKDKHSQIRIWLLLLLERLGL